MRNGRAVFRCFQSVFLDRRFGAGTGTTTTSSSELQHISCFFRDAKGRPEPRWTCQHQSTD